MGSRSGFCLICDVGPAFEDIFSKVFGEAAVTFWKFGRWYLCA
jgi:hypothetical protein